MNIKKQPELSKSETGLAKKNVTDVSFAKIWKCPIFLASERNKTCV